MELIHEETIAHAIGTSKQKIAKNKRTLSQQMLFIWSNRGMDMHAHRRSVLQAMVDAETQGNVEAFCTRHKLNAVRVRQMLSPNYREGRGFGERAARSLERQIGLPEMTFDAGAEALAKLKSPVPENKDGNHPVLERLVPEDEGNVIAWNHEDDLPPDDDRVWVDGYDYSFSSGNGLLQWEVRQKRALPFNLAFFRQKGLKPENCKLLVARGDSMEPYLFDHDAIMVDISDTHLRDGEVYAIHFEGESLVKQIFKQAGGGIVLHSFNDRKYRDKVIEPEMTAFVQIVGRVVYRSG